MLGTERAIVLKWTERELLSYGGHGESYNAMVGPGRAIVLYWTQCYSGQREKCSAIVGTDRVLVPWWTQGNMLYYGGQRESITQDTGKGSAMVSTGKAVVI